MASILYAIDCFKRPFSLLLNQKPLLSTCLGTMVSLAIIGIMINAIANSGLIQKNNPNVIEKSGTLSETQTLIYGNALIPISFGLLTQTKSPVYDPSIFSFDLFLITTSGSNIIKNRVNTFPCTSTQTSYPNPGNLRCITESEILLKGGKNDNDSIKLGIGLRICNSNTDGINCKSENEIKSFLFDKILIVNFPNFQYDVDNYDNPLKIITSFFSNPVNLQSKILTSINIKTAQLITDNGIISNNENSKEFYQLDSIVTSIGSLNDFMKNDNFDSSLMQTDFEVSKKDLAVTRRYQKFLELLAALSGIGNALIILGWLLSSLQVYTVYIGTVLNYLYVFHSNPKKKKNKNYPEKNEEEQDYEKENLETPNSNKKKVNFIEKNEEAIELQKIEGLQTNDMLLLGEAAEKENNMIKKGINNREESQLKNNNLVQVHSMDKLISKNEEETRIDIEKHQLKESDKDPKKIEMYVKFRQSQIKDEDNFGKINIGFIEHLFATIKNIVCKKKLTAREKLILKCEEIFKEDIDLVIILKRLQELEKLKILLLNSEQRTLFNLMSRPLIYVEEEVVNKQYTMQHELSNYYHYSRSVGLQKNPENFNNIIEVYRRMKEKNNKTELDIKILKFLSKDIHQFCQKFI